MPHNLGMLTCDPAGAPDSALGSFVDSFLTDAPWVRRRVETVSFVDVDTVRRQTTLDIDTAQLQVRASGCPFFEDRALAPLAILSKELLMNFDLRDRHGAALPVAPRQVDSFMALSALAGAARAVLGHARLPDLPRVVERLRQLTYDFPDEGDDPFESMVGSWAVPDVWTPVEKEAWSNLLGDESFSRLLRDFTFHFLLVTQVPTDVPTHIVKFSYEEFLPLSGLSVREAVGLDPAILPFRAPAVGWARL